MRSGRAKIRKKSYWRLSMVRLSCGGSETVCGGEVFVDDLVGDFANGLDPVDLADALAGSENVFPRVLPAVHVGEVDPPGRRQLHVAVSGVAEAFGQPAARNSGDRGGGGDVLGSGA